MRARDLAARSAVALGVAAWGWVLLHSAATYAAMLKEETELRAEATWLLRTACAVSRGAAMGSSLIRCDEARAVAARWVRLSAAERASAAVLRTLLDGARREIAALLRALGALGLAGYAGAVAARILAARADVARRQRFEALSFSAAWRQRNTAVVPIVWTDDAAADDAFKTD